MLDCTVKLYGLAASTIMWLQRHQNQELRPTIKDAVLSWPAATVGVLSGDSRAFSLSHSWMIRHYLTGKRVRIIDCAVRFDSNYLVDELLRLDEPVDSALLAVDIRRAFTPYQILEAITDIAMNGNKEHEVYYILAPFKQFFDGDVATDEATYLLHMLNERLSGLSRAGWPVIVVERADYEHVAFNQAYRQLQGLAKPLWQILKIQGPAGITSVLRTSIVGEINGTHSRTLQHPNGNGRASLHQVSSGIAERRPSIGR